jgi:hypothetical protein
MVALNLLERDGIKVIWLLHLAAVKASRCGRSMASEALIEIADVCDTELARLTTPAIEACRDNLS